MNEYLVVYPYIPNYRYSVFRELEASPGSLYYFAAGVQSRDGTIPTLDATHLQRMATLENTWLGPFLWQHRLLRLIFSRKWTAVIFNGDYGHLSTWVAAAILRIRRIPVAYWTIGWHKPDRGLKKWYRLAFYSLTQRLMLYGNDGRNIGISFGYPPSKMGVIYNSSGTPEDSQTLIPATPPSQNPWVVGCVIRLNAVKRLDLLIRAIAILRESRTNVKVRIVGEGPERAALELLANNLGVPLELPGAVYDEASLKEFYRECAVSVVPSAAGLSVTQSLRYGRPVITHDNPHKQMPEYEAIVEGQTGSLFREGDPSSLASAIGTWLGTQDEHWLRTSKDCHAEITNHWTGHVHAMAIQRELEILTDRQRRS